MSILKSIGSGLGKAAKGVGNGIATVAKPFTAAAGAFAKEAHLKDVGNAALDFNGRKVVNFVKEEATDLAAGVGAIAGTASGMFTTLRTAYQIAKEAAETDAIASKARTEAREAQMISTPSAPQTKETKDPWETIDAKEPKVTMASNPATSVATVTQQKTQAAKVDAEDATIVEELKIKLV